MHPPLYQFYQVQQHQIEEYEVATILPNFLQQHLEGHLQMLGLGQFRELTSGTYIG